MTKMNLFLLDFCGISLPTVTCLINDKKDSNFLAKKIKLFSLQGLQDVKSSLTGADVSGWKFHGSEYGNFNTGRRPSMNQGSKDWVLIPK